jgi:uncharacterized tellurite resistance protein B-like protein
MLNSLKKFLFSDDVGFNQTASSIESDAKKHKLEIATCALFIELAKADGNFSNEERDFIISTMKKCFNLNESEVDLIFELANEKVDKSVSVYEFTEELNKHFTQEEKDSVIKNLWRLIYNDKKLNAYEDSLIKKIGFTLNLEHKRIIDLKLSVKKELNID